MKTVSAREANQSFSKLLGEAAGGEEVIITKRGKPVAKLVSVEESGPDEERQRAIERMVKRMRRGIKLGGRGFTRDEMHER
ncbi:MAG: type II toxin-antitoxin system prevent-host-death family antitoxin [Rhodospirillales bacterium]|nr:type II toxin-antitoxin system prevent-host-death family antitoxin [Rhodospirillales bacterium]